MKNYEVLLTPAAVQDLKNLHDFISDASGFPEVAWNYIEKLRAQCQALGLAPIRGNKRDDLRPNLRITPLDKNAVAAFEVNEENRTVTILNIFYGGRDYDTLMRDG